MTEAKVDNGTRVIGVAILGFGNVGTEVYELLSRRSDEFANRFNARFEVHRILVRNLEKKRKVNVPSEILTTSIDDVLGDPKVEVVVELIGGVEPAFECVSRSIRTGRPVVTANKHLLAEKGSELELLSIEENVPLLYEAAVGGIVPVITALGRGVNALKVKGVRGLLNSTTNYILSNMYSKNMDYERTLKIAQDQGYAEPDPNLDISGMDTAHKLSILSRLLFGKFLPLEKVDVEGIEDRIDVMVNGARHRGKKVKLIGTLSMKDDKDGTDPEATVKLEEVGKDDRLHIFDGILNCIIIETRETGSIEVSGRGAGGLETATAIISDLLCIAMGTCRFAGSSPSGASSN